MVGKVDRLLTGDLPKMTTNDSAKQPNAPHFATIGFGEAAQAFVKGLKADIPNLRVSAYDLKTDAAAADIAAAKWQDYQTTGVTGQAEMRALLAEADMVFSLVTADQASNAAKAAAAVIRPGCLYFDGNSCAPKTKVANAALIDGAGGRYIDAAIMSPVHPLLHKSPMLLSGPWAEQGRDVLAGLGMSARVEPGEIGRASSIKMVRSIMVKGLEALVAECVLAGRRAGVEDYVIDSLEASYPGFGWRDRAAYNLERMTRHGQRRAAEMREVAHTVADLGLPNDMAQAITGWQQRIGDLGLPTGGETYQSRADAILAALATSEKGKP
jgi:3-hydroxyisobutyrate dehydrogenase-like beta-hydroxyacid dehydrogenase